MKNTNTNEFKNALRNLLVPMINEKVGDYEQTAPEKPFSWLVGIAKSEVPHEFKKGNHAGMEYFLSGLGLSLLPYNYCDIIRTSEELHGCKLTEKQADMVCERWFSFIAAKVLQFADKE